MIDVIIVVFGGKRCAFPTNEKDCVVEWIRDIMNETEQYDISIYTKKMTQQEIDALPEFEGI
jgi:hypothetical protein